MEKVYATKCAQLDVATLWFTKLPLKFQFVASFNCKRFKCSGKSISMGFATDKSCRGSKMHSECKLSHDSILLQPRNLATSSIVLGFRFIQIAQTPKLDFDAKIAIFRCSNLKFIGSVWEKNWHRWQKLSNRSIPVSSDEVMLNTMYYPIIERLL